MKKIFFKKVNNRGPAPYEAKGFRSGFVILFAVTISSILLAIALGVATVALKETKFGTSARDTNDAFFAADTGTEYALFNDRSTNNAYPAPGPYSFPVPGLGMTGQACAIVTVDKTVASVTTVTAKGYNSGGGSGTCNPVSSSVERELKTTYVTSSGVPPSAVPVVTISATPTSGTVNSVNPSLNWSVTNSPTSCTASGDWSGLQAASGPNISQGVLTTVKTYTYTLTCSNAIGIGAPASATVVVSPPPVNGVCSATHYSCNVGTSANNANGDTAWTWSCNGSYGGTNAFCSENNTPVNIPTVTTTTPPPANITQTTASGGGNITAQNGASVTQSGIVWSTAANPTIVLPTKTTDGVTGTTGPWTSNMTGLTAGTLYHVRAYATNSAGTAYGADVQFTTTAAVSGSDIFTTPGSTNWIAPAGVSSVTVEAWGAGASGTNGNNGGNGADGTGGGGGAYAKSISISVVSGNSYSVVIGAGGSSNGASGGDSKFNTSTVIAKGAVGSSAGTAAASTGATKFSGGSGAIGSFQHGGGGGSSAGTAANGGNGAAIGTAGAAPAGGGAGGKGGSSGAGTNGASGNIPGGGGGGGFWDPDGFASSGGGGASGKIVISY